MKQTSRARKPSHERGAILVLSLFVCVSLLILAFPLLCKFSNQYRTMDHAFKDLTAQNLSEAGIEQAIWELNHGNVLMWEGDDSLRSLLIPASTISSEMTQGRVLIELTAFESDNPVIESTGEVPIVPHVFASKKIRVILSRQGNALFNTGVFAREKVTLASNLTIDGDVGTNSIEAGSIEIGSNTEVHGDAVCGPGGDPEVCITLDSNSSVDGYKRSASELKELPSVIVPEGLPPFGDFFCDGDLITLSESGEYSSFIVDNNSSIEISGDVSLHVTGAFSFGSNTALNIQEGGSLTLYLSGTIFMDSNCALNNVLQDPTKLLIYGTDTLSGPVYFDSNMPMYAAIYMPEGDLNFSSNVQFHGAAIGRTISLNSNVYLRYEEELGSLAGTPGEGGGDFTVASWNGSVPKILE